MGNIGSHVDLTSGHREPQAKRRNNCILSEARAEYSKKKIAAILKTSAPRKERRST
jgi:hypothetical protein